ncbi:barwin-like endoglucanase [Testicularia cyperi]|uniref:cellulase n=1 Tax=Testicularia cyperi TaxID=1882483 RepID=A0A317XHY0_9BASI|nr:barwin-like endoglucanase [Testicularia cyperi]PWY97846.1 barwin-like endoglucanase [Testicularia cyperi]
MYAGQGVNGGGLPTTPYATRFWDCCPAAFSYTPKGGVYAPVDACHKDGKTLFPFDIHNPGKNGCEGGDRFACSCIQPWVDSKDPTLAYGFAAYNIHEADGSIESACYLAEFKPNDSNGKPMKVTKIILQNINTSGNILKGSFDFNLAGGGVGDFPAGCVAQWGQSWGSQYGGVTGAKQCCNLPPALRSSCLFRFTYFGENPALAGTPKRVRCPTGIIDRSGSQRKDDAQVAPYSGVTDATGKPAADGYKRNRGVCDNIDPLGVVSSVCGGHVLNSRTPSRHVKRRPSPAGTTPGVEVVPPSAPKPTPKSHKQR